MIMKTENTFGTSSINKEIICYSCDIPEHQALSVVIAKEENFVSFASLLHLTIRP